MTETFTAFLAQRRLASGPLAEVALAIKRADAKADTSVLVFRDHTGQVVDLDLRGTDDEMLARLPDFGEEASEEVLVASGPRGRGRPKLGVVAREVTLLPRHWEWLNAQPGGASVALRKLVDTARRDTQASERQRMAREAAYRFMSAMAGDLPRFEEATRALFANDRSRLTTLIARWPGDIRDYVVNLAFSAAE